MGIYLVRGTSKAGLLTWFVVVAAAAVLSMTLSVAGQGQNDCTSSTTSGHVLGHCTPIRLCEYFMRILQQKVVTASDRSLLRENQCNPPQQYQHQQPQPQQHQQGDGVHVCCPLNEPSASTHARRESLGALKHPLLPAQCGTVKWRRSNDTETKIKEYPWLALIEYSKPNQEKLHACGGVLISQRYILTAAHCLSGHSISRLEWEVRAVRLGEWDTMTNPDCQVNAVSGVAECAPSYQDILVEDIIIHPLYNKDGLSQTNDIAMIRLRDPAQLSDYVQPICLPNKQLRADELEDLVMEVGGWQAKSSSRMRKSEVHIESIEACQKQYGARNIQIMASQLCGAANTNECHGNSGGPLMLFKNDAYLLGGILSFGPVPCPSTDWPDIYTRVASYIDWIHGNLKA